MTAYSRFILTTNWGQLIIEVQSVNRKHLEVFFHCPKELNCFDPEIKKQIQKKIFRGKVTLSISYTLNEAESSVDIVPNISLAKEVYNGWKCLEKELDLKDSESAFLHSLTQNPLLFQSQVRETFSKKIKKDLFIALNHALNQLIEMRCIEGQFLQKELENYLDSLNVILEKIEVLHKNLSQECYQKLKERLESLLNSLIEEQDERVLKEVALLAEKGDLSEEIVRIGSHLSQFAQVLKKENKSIGKTLDFIIQELHREWNTIGAKCANHEISRLVIEAKSEIEKMREQIQNIE